jgi:hypothetical protein
MPNGLDRLRGVVHTKDGTEYENDDDFGTPNIRAFKLHSRILVSPRCFR